jgi:CRISPR/Cas system-associated exonuclease Cas4 (RecB family)
MGRSRFIRASEIGEYVYCQRAWWLHHCVGLEPAGRERRERGTALHTQHGRQVWLSHLLFVSGMILLALALIVLVLR